MTKQHDQRVRKFNPGIFQSDQEIVEQFVVRQNELDIVLDVLRGNIDSPSCQHQLVVAPRGRGKSMLLARVAAELRIDGDFSGQLFPLRFMEESQEIFGIADFWLETLFYLASQLTKTDPDLSMELRATHTDLSKRWRDEQLDTRARAAVLDAADRIGRKLVVMVENLQSLCEDTDDDFGWQLRKALQSETQIMLLATATSRFEGLDEVDQPFYELFRQIDLQPLDTEDCRRLWRAVSGDEVTGREIKPLQILTGGSPRLLVIIADFARHRSLRQLMEELVTLIDDHTEYFRGHLDSFAKTERRVYLAVIDLWRPSRTGEIAARARMEVRTVSTLLGRLVKRGAVLMEGAGNKRLYSAAERLYSIYYKLRRERDEAAVVRNLVHFMTVFYSGPELAELSDNLVAEATFSTSIRKGIERAVAEMPETAGVFADAFSLHFGEAGIEKIEAAKKGADVEHPRDIAVRVTDNTISDSDENSLVAIAINLIARADAQRQRGDWQAAVTTLEEAVERFGDRDEGELLVWVAMALVNKGGVQGERGEPEAAIAAYDEVVERFGDRDEGELLVQVAKALFNKGIVQGERGEPEAAIAAYDEVVERFGDRDEGELLMQVAKSLGSMAEAHQNIGKADQALEIAERIEQQLGTLTDDDAVSFGWWSRWIKATALFELGRPKEAMHEVHYVFEGFLPENEVMMRAIQTKVPELIASGAQASSILEIFSTDETKSSAIAPLVVALRQETGETVRAPAEVLEVAADIREQISMRRQKLGTRAAGNSAT